MINNRQQNGRRRGRNGPRPQGGGPRIDGGNRIDNRARGNAAQLHEKYKSLANDAQRQGDRVLTEYYFQFADHYFRILAESRPRDEQGGQRYERNGRYDPRDEFGEGLEGEEGTPDETFGRAEPRADDGRNPRDEQPRDDRYRQDRGYQGRDGQGERNGRDRQDRGAYRREDNRGDDGRGYREERPRHAEHLDATAGGTDQANAAQPIQADPASAELAGEEPRRRRGRPRRDVSGTDAGGGERIEIDRLPPAVNADTAPANDTGDDAAPRRRRARRVREDGTAAVEG